MDEPEIRGSCLCGGVRWAHVGKAFLFNHCHCVQCRKSHGAAFASNLHVRPAQFRWLAGESQVARFESSPGVRRSFCSVCGGNVAVVLPDQVVIPAATLDDPLDDKPVVHFFAGEKVAWLELADGLPAFPTWPPRPQGETR
ncbi:MAG TPA: GFA family protein [Myxococcota bacterium]|nr:GFA family protein [Myxococcota bacterium]